MTHPYTNLDTSKFWRKSVDPSNISLFDPVSSTKGLKLSTSTKVMTSGSCFAQHIARHLRLAGFDYMITENAHPAFGHHSEGFNYGTFTARYGNVYTPRQLLQLVRRSIGQFDSSEDEWSGADGEFIDPFRPQIQPGGFRTSAELQCDRSTHLKAVRLGLETCDVFVFTLGLTEAWVNKRCGTVLPVCPGVSGGEFDHDIYEFQNFSVEECNADLAEAIKEIRELNPDVWILLTVSPVPLVATASESHVAVATSLSKSILRVVAENVSEMEKVVYFPSYEVITSSATAGSYWASDLREVNEAGVSHAMGLFFKHFTDDDYQPNAAEPASIAVRTDRLQMAIDAVEVECDQLAYDQA